METEKILIGKNTEALAIFNRELQSVWEGANVIPQLWMKFQPWDAITTLPRFEEVLKNPMGEFDKLLLANSGLDPDSMRGIKPKPEHIAAIWDIDYAGFKSIITGQKVVPGCKSCGQLPQKIMGRFVLQYNTYLKYREFLLFDDKEVLFSVNESKAEENRRSFDIYIEDPKQIAIYNEWKQLEDLLNKFKDKINLEKFAELTGGMMLFSYGDYKVHVQMEALLNLITLETQKA